MCQHNKRHAEPKLPMRGFMKKRGFCAEPHAESAAEQGYGKQMCFADTPLFFDGALFVVIHHIITDEVEAGENEEKIHGLGFGIYVYAVFFWTRIERIGHGFTRILCVYVFWGTRFFGFFWTRIGRIRHGFYVRSVLVFSYPNKKI